MESPVVRAVTGSGRQPNTGLFWCAWMDIHGGLCYWLVDLSLTLPPRAIYPLSRYSTAFFCSVPLRSLLTCVDQIIGNIIVYFSVQDIE